jgi:hypothetical protein
VSNGIIEWAKSSLSFANGNCVEVGAWRKASFSGGNGGGCVEVQQAGDASQFPHKADAGRLILVRDSKLGDESPELAFTVAEWDAFTAGVKAGEFDPAG